MPVGRPPNHKPANAEKIGVRKPPRTSVALLRQFFEIMDRDPRSYDVIALRAGVTKQTLSYWRHGHRTPSAQSLEDVLYTLGYRVVMVPLAPQLDLPKPEIDLRPESIWHEGVEYIRADLAEMEAK